ncbi:MAG: hypothetical protein ACFFKA_06770 [Candidatus Thorarchaeota archaeon]
MNRNNISKLILLTVLMFTIFSIPFVSAEPGKWPAYLFKKGGYFPFSDPPGYRIWSWWMPWIGPGGHDYLPAENANGYCFYRIGWIVSDYEIEMGYDPGPPYQYNLFINDKEIVMQRWTWTVPKGEVLYPDGVVKTVNSRAWMWIVRFDPGYFEAGKTYKIREQFLVQKPYQESDDRDWRPYVNYMSGGGPPNAPFTWEDWYGPIGVVNDQIYWLHVV